MESSFSPRETVSELESLLLDKKTQRGQLLLL